MMQMSKISKHACSGMSNSLRPYGLQAVGLHCPWNFPGKNTGMGCHFLFQGIFLTQGLNPHLCTVGRFFTIEPPEGKWTNLGGLDSASVDRKFQHPEPWQIIFSNFKQFPFLCFIKTQFLFSEETFQLWCCMALLSQLAQPSRQDQVERKFPGFAVGSSVLAQGDVGPMSLQDWAKSASKGSVVSLPSVSGIPCLTFQFKIWC